MPVSEMVFGNMPNDGGYFLFNDEEKKNFLKVEPNAKKFFRKFIGSQEFLYNESRWCFWLKDASPKELKELPLVLERVQRVKEVRLKSNRPTTNKLASFPTLFGEIRQPSSDYLVFPEVTSERRNYIPVGFFNKNVITSNKNYTIANGTLFHFGVLSSIMHMAWIRQVAGRLESRFQYSTGIVYNNFPWAESPTTKQKEAVEKSAQGVLDARAQYPDDSYSIGKGTPSIRQSRRPLLPPPAIPQRNQTNRVPF